MKNWEINNDTSGNWGKWEQQFEYAEDWLRKGTECTGDLIYIATMRPCGEEARQKIARHHKLRVGKGFQTLECYENLQELDIPDNHGILLECMSNLIANELYDENGGLRDAHTVMEHIMNGIGHLRQQTEYLVIVTNEVTADINGYSEETRVYQRVLGCVNQRISALAEQITEVVYGIPISLKKEAGL